jgi:hypothetical protein
MPLTSGVTDDRNRRHRRRARAHSGLEAKKRHWASRRAWRCVARRGRGSWSDVRAVRGSGANTVWR